MKSNESTVKLKQDTYSDSYRNIILAAGKYALKSEDGLLTVKHLFMATVELYPELLKALLSRNCIFPHMTCEEECSNNKQVFFSAETDRILSMYGGEISLVMREFSRPVQIEAEHVLAALLLSETKDIVSFLSFNGVIADKSTLRKTVIPALLKRDEFRQKEENEKNSAMLKLKLRNIRKRLEAKCFGQEEAIRKIIAQLDLFWSQTTMERGNKPLSFCFIGATGTGKSLLASELIKALAEELSIDEVPILDMSRFAAEQTALDMIGRDVCWKDGGTEGHLTRLSANNSNGVILIENFDKGHRDAVTHIETMLTDGHLKDNLTGHDVYFSSNIIIMTSSLGVEFFESEKFIKFCENSSYGIPKDKLVDGICSRVENNDVILAGTMRTLFNKIDNLVLFKKHSVSSIKQIIGIALDKSINRLENSYSLKVKCNKDELCNFFMDTMQNIDSANGVSTMVDSSIYIPIQEALLEGSVSLDKKGRREIIIEVGKMPTLGFSLKEQEQNSLAWLEERTKKRITAAKRLDYKIDITQAKQDIVLSFNNLKYLVMPSIEAAGFFSVLPPNVSIKELVGLSLPWETVQRSLDYIQNPIDSKLKPETGFILYGPPGTGKTSFAKAVANELGVPFIPVSGADLVSYGSTGIRYVFETARRYHAILFIDQIDAVGARGTGDNSKDSVINTLLAELDGYEERQIIVIGATNRHDKLDLALMRPGRLHTMIEIGNLVNEDDRRKLVDIICKSVNIELDNKLKSFIVHTTNGWSPASLKATIREAIHLASKNHSAVTRDDFIKARNIEYHGEETQKRNLSPKLRKTIAIHEAGHALIATLHACPWVQLTIANTGSYAGFLECVGDEYNNYTEAELNVKIEISLAGYVAEHLLSSPIEGSGSDFNVAKHYALRILQAGFNGDMSFAIAPVTTPEEWSKVAPKVQDIINARMQAVKILLNANIELLKKVADELNDKGILFEDDVNNLRKVVECSTSNAN